MRKHGDLLSLVEFLYNDDGKRLKDKHVLIKDGTEFTVDHCRGQKFKVNVCKTNLVFDRCDQGQHATYNPSETEL